MSRRALTQYALLVLFFVAPALFLNFGPRYAPLPVEVYIAVLVISLLFGIAALVFFVLAVMSIVRRRGRSVSGEYLRREAAYTAWAALFAALIFTGVLAATFTPLAPVYGALVLAYALSVMPESARRLEFRAAIDVDCTPEEAFDFIVDPRNVTRYFPQIELARPVDLPVHVGSTIRYRVRERSIVLEDDEKVTALEPNRIFATEANLGQGIYTLTPVDGRTELAYSAIVMLTLAQAAIGGAIGRRSLVKSMASRREESLRRLKDILEARSPVSV